MKKLLLSATGFLFLAGMFLLLIPHPFSWIALLGWLLAFTCFDVVGFTGSKIDSSSTDSIERVQADAYRIEHYRVLQIVFEIVSIVFLIYKFNWKVGLAASVLHYFLAADVLFYLIQGIPLQEFTWFKTSPVIYLFNHILHRPAPIWSVITSASIGIVLAGWLIL